MRSSGKLLTIRIMPQLREAIDAMPPSGELRFLLNDYGKPFASAAAFGNKFADWCKAAGLQPVLCADGRVRSFRAHGLRKAAAVAMAHAGCTEQEMMSVGGWSSAAQLQVYLAEARQELLADAAMDKLAAAAVQAEARTPNYKLPTPNLQPGAKPLNLQTGGSVVATPAGFRTSDLSLRRRLLYPTELRGRAAERIGDITFHWASARPRAARWKTASQGGAGLNRHPERGGPAVHVPRKQEAPRDAGLLAS